MIPEENAVPGAVIAIQTLGDFLGYNPHCHVLCTDGAFYGKTMFRVAPRFILKDLEKLFQCKVFKMLLSRKKITEDFIEMATGPPKVQEYTIDDSVPILGWVGGAGKKIFTQKV